jgi:hypothetical protein
MNNKLRAPEKAAEVAQWHPLYAQFCRTDIEACQIVQARLPAPELTAQRANRMQPRPFARWSAVKPLRRARMDRRFGCCAVRSGTSTVLVRP